MRIDSKIPGVLTAQFEPPDPRHHSFYRRRKGDRFTLGLRPSFPLLVLQTLTRLQNL